MTSVILQRVKYPHNLAAAIRAAACFDAEAVYYTGKRFEFKDGERLPREERMKGYRSVEVFETERPFDDAEERLRRHAFSNGTSRRSPALFPVCVELTPTAQPLTHFEHPDHALYVFGPEDGHVSQAFRALCYSFVYIPAHHCLNLAAAVNVVLAHRAMQRGSVQTPSETEGRGIIEVVGWDGK